MSFHGLSMYIAIAGGGAIGTALRLLVFHLVSRQGSDLSFVLSTVMVNVIGSGALGALVAMRSVGPQLTSDTRSIILIGVLGGFTTFSAFTFDIISIATEHGINLTLIYVVGTIVTALLAFYGCYLLVKAF